MVAALCFVLKHDMKTSKNRFSRQTYAHKQQKEGLLCHCVGIRKAFSMIRRLSSGLDNPADVLYSFKLSVVDGKAYDFCDRCDEP